MPYANSLLVTVVLGLALAACGGFLARTQRILNIARQANPGIDTAVRAHSIGELGLLERQNVGIAIMGERELALGLVDYAFSSLGLSEEKAYSVVRNMRKTGKGGVFERRHALIHPALQSCGPIAMKRTRQMILEIRGHAWSQLDIWTYKPHIC